MKEGENYWSNRYQEGRTGWDIGAASPPLTDLCDWLDPSMKILLPGAGNAHEADCFRKRGFDNLYVMDIAKEPLDQLKLRVPEYPEEQLLHMDFFALKDQFDVMLEQTFFCALPREWRKKYVAQAHQILKPGGMILGVMFAHEFEKDGPPNGGSPEEYRNLFEPTFEVDKMESCYNSISERRGRELFIRLIKKH